MIRPIISPSASLSKIANLIGAEFDQELEISGISQNADDCLPGDLFVAIKGNKLEVSWVQEGLFWGHDKGVKPLSITFK